MRKPVAPEVNRQNLIDIVGILRGCDAFPFFGTLLGLVRNGDILPHDDDVDIYANVTDRAEVLERLSRSRFEIDWNDDVNQTPWFVQARRIDGDDISYVDIYFFERQDEERRIVERWNFSARWEDEENHIHIPADFIYPVVEARLFGVGIPLPARPEACCEYLYGRNWRVPMIKRLGYSTSIVDHVPMVLVSPDQFSEIIERFRLIEESLEKVEKKLEAAKRELAEVDSSILWKLRQALFFVPRYLVAKIRTFGQRR